MNDSGQLLEFVQSGRLPAGAVDRAKGVIKGVKVLGEKSRNPPPFNHLYPPQCRQSALPFINGCQVYVNHPTRNAAGETRDVRERMGFFANAREGGDGAYADWHFNPKHALAEDVFWDAENNPNGLGFSINGHSDHKRKTEAGTVVESIDALHSIDLVSKPATTSGLFESLRQPMRRKVSELIESLKAARPGYARGLREMAEAGLMTPDSQMDEPSPKGEDVQEEADHEVALKQGFKGAMNAVLDDDSMDMKGKLQKLKEIMQAQEKLMSGGGGKKGGKGPPCDEDKDEAMESLRLQNKALLMLMEAKITPTRVLTKALEACKSEAEIKELIESERAQGAAPPWGARSAAPTREQAQTPTTIREARQPDNGQAGAPANPDEARKASVSKLRRG